MEHSYGIFTLDDHAIGSAAQIDREAPTASGLSANRAVTAEIWDGRGSLQRKLNCAAMTRPFKVHVDTPDVIWSRL
jgi:hypothetical protein